MKLKALLLCLLLLVTGAGLTARTPKTKAMIKVYVMKSCPDCDKLKPALEGDGRYEVIDISTHVRKLKAFIRLRDTHPAFDSLKAKGSIGIPCFVWEDGRVSFDPEEAGVKQQPLPEIKEGAACNLDGTGC